MKNWTVMKNSKIRKNLSYSAGLGPFHSISTTVKQQGSGKGFVMKTKLIDTEKPPHGVNDSKESLTS